MLASCMALKMTSESRMGGRSAFGGSDSEGREGEERGRAPFALGVHLRVCLLSASKGTERGNGSRPIRRLRRSIETLVGDGRGVLIQTILLWLLENTH